MAIVSLTQVKQQLGIDLTDTSDDDELNEYIDALAPAVEAQLGIALEQKTVTEKLHAHHGLLVSHVPATALTSITSLDGATSYDVSGLDLDEDTGEIVSIGGTLPRGRVTVVYTAGYAVPPANYVRGALLVLQHVWETQRGVGGVQPGVDDGDNYDPRYSYTVPRRAREWFGNPLPGVA